MIYQFMQNFINQYLKRNKNVNKSEKHNCLLEMIITNAKYCHSLVTFIYFNLIICVFKIEFNKVRSVHKTI